MSGHQDDVIEQIRRTACKLPASQVKALAESLRISKSHDLATMKRAALSMIAEPSYRSQVSALLDAWQKRSAEVPPESMAMALLAAAHCEEYRRQSETFELVWTGPGVGAIPLRRTDQALLEVINAARKRVTIVSFAVYKAAKIREALVSAADRGIELRIILETHEGAGEANTIQALGEKVISRSSIFVWPEAKRPVDPSGSYGSLHAKCAVSDGERLFISSANLTDYAMSLNMELGVLVNGGSLPRSVEEHFSRLIESGTLALCEPPVDPA